MNKWFDVHQLKKICRFSVRVNNFEVFLLFYFSTIKNTTRSSIQLIERTQWSTRIEYSPRTESEKCGNAHTVSTKILKLIHPARRSLAGALLPSFTLPLYVFVCMIQRTKGEARREVKWNDISGIYSGNDIEKYQQQQRQQHRNRIYRNIAFTFQNWNITSTKWFSLCLPLVVLSVFFLYSIRIYDCLLFWVCLHAYKQAATHPFTFTHSIHAPASE